MVGEIGEKNKGEKKRKKKKVFRLPKKEALQPTEKFITKAPAVEASSRRLNRIKPIGDFLVDSTNIDQLPTKAKERISEGADPKTPVEIIFSSKEGLPVKEELPLEKVAKLDEESRVYKKLESEGGIVDLGAEVSEKHVKLADGGGGDPPSIKQKTRQALFFVAARTNSILKEQGKNPKERASKIKPFFDAEVDVRSDGVSEDKLRLALGKTPTYSGTMMGAGGGMQTLQGLASPDLPSRWYLIGDAARIGFIWMMDQHKFRFQYTILGKHITLPWSRKDYYKERRKKAKKWRKMSDLEKRLDIFDINLEDIFDVDTLSIEEVFELDDLEKVKPTMDEYRAMTKLMKEEGYYEYAEAASAFDKGIR